MRDILGREIPIQRRPDQGAAMAAIAQAGQPNVTGPEWERDGYVEPEPMTEPTVSNLVRMLFRQANR